MDDVWLPEDPAARLAAVVDLADAQRRRVQLIAAQVETLCVACDDVADALVRLFAARELAARAVPLRHVDDEVAAAVAGTATTARRDEPAGTVADPDGAPDRLGELAARLDAHDAVADIATRVGDYAAAVASRLPTLEDLEVLAGELCGLDGITPADDPAGVGRIVVIDLDACGVAELAVIAACGEEDAAVDWTSRRAVAAVPAAVAARLDATRAARDLGPATPVRFDPIPLPLRVVDCLEAGMAPADAYDEALLRGATCPAVQRAAARWLETHGDLEP